MNEPVEDNLAEKIGYELGVISNIADDMCRISSLQEDGEKLRIAHQNIIRYGLMLVDRSMRTEAQQAKWLLAMRKIDNALEGWEDEESGATFDRIRGIRKILDESFDE